MSLAVAVLGLGEAGAALASDLAAQGVPVRGWDPVVKEVPSVAIVSSASEAVRGAEVVVSINSARVALEVARNLAPDLGPGQVFADFNTASPSLKESLHGVVAATGAEFVDVALMAPVPGRGLRTPALASGVGARRFAALFQPLGMPVTVVDERPGSAASRKLLRSVFMKGLAAVLLEGLAAAEKLGWAEWYKEEVAATLRESDGSLVERLITGSRKHAARRVHEMNAAAELLLAVEVPPRVSLAAAEVLRELAQGENAGRT
ncbi:6-phosphogluconate dehydrogenase [Limnochorda pilosa]|uniref:6-phosphogluconate dehydrogenase n=1 Tax=Limnochorda pilosa TaxID=1555112 RepID=A0A0K2SM58_LIMPI|nr:6-phosphogluconate dehydrogenase [Limnochorda pilosa]